MNLYPTPEDKRKMGESVLSFDLRLGMQWLESAAAQEAGRLDEYKAAVKEWEARRPRARDFVPFEVQNALKDRERLERRRARREMIDIWGPVLGNREGLVCEEHPDLPWPHGDCAGPGMLLLEENPLMGFEPHAAQRTSSRRGPRSSLRSRGTGSARARPDGLRAPGSPARRDSPPDAPGRKRFEGPTQGWILVPTEDKIDDSSGPRSRSGARPRSSRAGTWGKAFKGDTNLSLQERVDDPVQDLQAGPVDAGRRRAALRRLRRAAAEEAPGGVHVASRGYGGFEMFAMTPLDTNTAYVRREIYKKRESPGHHGRQGSVHDNPTLDKATVAPRDRRDVRHLRPGPRVRRVRRRRRADLPGVRALRDPGAVEPRVRPLVDVVVGIDPGIRNAGIVFVGFDRDNTPTSSTSCCCRTRPRRTTRGRSAPSSPGGASRRSELYVRR
jgi:hypothetical protein